MSSIILPPRMDSSMMTSLTHRAYNDPVIFDDDRVLKTLLRKEANYLPLTTNYFQTVQTELKVHMRKEVADWMLEVCIDRNCNPEVFSLAMNYLDRFLSVCRIGRSQLQLLGAVCLMVAWKVREHEPLPSLRLVEYSDYNLNSMDVVEWEVLLLSKLDWDMSAVIALDFVEHIIQRVTRFFRFRINVDMIRRHSEALVTMCSAHYIFSCVSPCLIASACVITTLRPMLETAAAGAGGSNQPLLRVDSPSPSSCSSAESAGTSALPDLEQLLDGLEAMTSISKVLIRECMEQIEILMHASLPPSPAPSHESSDKRSRPRSSSEGPTFRGRRLFVTGSPPPSHETSTPTKVLDVSRRDC